LSDILKLNGYSDIFKRPIFVVGLPYGGGTRTARLIRNMGVWTGPTIEGPKSDPRDLLENKLIREKLIKPTLKHMECDPDGLKALPNPRRRVNLVFPTKEGNINLQEKLNRMLKSQAYNHAQRWMYNDARLTLMWRSFITDFPNADWVIIRQDKDSYVQACLSNPEAFDISPKTNFWGHIAKVYSKRFDMLCARVDNAHEINFSNIQEGNLSELNVLSGKIGIQHNPKRKGQKNEPKRWKHS
jgi:hypothetical protein